MSSTTVVHSLSATLRRLSEQEEVPPLTPQFITESFRPFRSNGDRLILRVGRRQAKEIESWVVGHGMLTDSLTKRGITIQVLAQESFYQVVERQ